MIRFLFVCTIKMVAKYEIGGGLLQVECRVGNKCDFVIEIGGRLTKW